jgi:GDPmannose 4,6-dehydratase
MDSIRDWGHAKDYVRGMWLMLQQPHGDDFVLATGETHSVREFTERSFAHVGITLEWRGKGEDERGVCTKTGKTLVKVDPRYYRPTEVDFLQGDAAKAKRILGWEPETTFEELVKDMMESDLRLVDLGRNRG